MLFTRTIYYIHGINPQIEKCILIFFLRHKQLKSHLFQYTDKHINHGYIQESLN